jgi:RNA polymerase sigma-70 factor (ECF subfamily)
VSETDIPEVYRRTIGPLYAYVSRRCGGERALAEDVVQETWLRAVDVWRRQGVPDTPAAWLTTVAHNLLVTHFRRRRPVALDAAVAENALAAVDEGIGSKSADTAQLIQWGLAQLPQSEAGILEAFHFDERPTASIAKDLRLSDRAVEGRLRRARLKLRRVIEKTISR